MYRGRLAPSPTGFLHLGHARTFWAAQERARCHRGILILRNEDLDPARAEPAFMDAIVEDLKWFGIGWNEGPDLGGPFAPYNQSERISLYRDAFHQLRDAGCLYPCVCSRKDIQAAARAPHAADDELLYPGTCRGQSAPSTWTNGSHDQRRTDVTAHTRRLIRQNWRFRVPDGETMFFNDENMGPQGFVAGKDFGDFVVWRYDDVPSYQLAVVVDDSAMRITEVVRGADLLVSTARQLLLYRALGLVPPKFFHCPLLTNEQGERLAKRHDALSLRTLRASGISPESLRSAWR